MSQPEPPRGTPLPSSIIYCLNAFYVPNRYNVLVAQVAQPGTVPLNGADIAIWALVAHCDSAGQATFALVLTEWIALRKLMVRATEFRTEMRLPSGEYALALEGDVSPDSALAKCVEEGIKQFRVI